MDPAGTGTGWTNIGPTVDVYSLAATIYTFLAGHSPVEIPDGDNREFAMLNQEHLMLRCRELVAKDVPVELERILAIAMAKDPRQRYQTVEDFAYALQQVQASLHRRYPVRCDGDPVHHRHDDDDDATNLRPIQMIDPERKDAAEEVPSSPGETAAELS